MNRPSVPNFRWIVAWEIRIFIALVIVHAFAFASSKSIPLSPLVILVLSALMGWLGVADSRWRKESLFIASLGVSQRTIAAIWAVSVLIIEIVVWAVAG